MNQISVRFKLIRSGTTKGIYIDESDLPEDYNERERALLNLFGSGDRYQIDGIGGGNQYANKVIILEKAERDKVHYRFGQLGVERRFIDWRGNDGNLVAGLAIYSYLKGYGILKDNLYRILAVNTMTKDRAMLEFKTDTRGPLLEEYHQNMYENLCVNVKCKWENPGGGLTGYQLPTGNSRETLEIDGTNVFLSIIDCVSLITVVRMDSIGMNGKDLPGMEDANVLEKSRKIRIKSSLLSGFTTNQKEAEKITLFPLLAAIGKPVEYMTIDGRKINQEDYDLRANVVSLNEYHHAISVSAAIAISYGTSVKGSLPYELMCNKHGDDYIVRIGHPSGIISLNVKKMRKGKVNVSLIRNSRLIAEGVCYASYE